MFFGLSNTLFLFQNLINDVLRPYLDDFVIIYINDILIFSEIFKKYKQHIRLILNKFIKIKFYLNINKCEFHAAEIKYLNLIIFNKKIKINSEKIIAVQQ